MAPPPTDPAATLAGQLIARGSAFNEEGKFAEALACYADAARLGNTDAMVLAGLHMKVHSKEDTTTARRWFEQAANAGNHFGMFHLGLLAKEANSLEEAATWFERAADAGDGEGMLHMGLLLHERGELKPAVAWFRRAHDAGCPDGTVRLADAYYSGEGVDRDIGKAVDLWEQGLDAGYESPKPAYAAALCHDLGRGTPQDFKRALKLFVYGAERGSVPCMERAGEMHMKGRGDVVPINFLEAERWMKKAADKGSSNAMVGLASMYMTGGHGLEQNVPLAYFCMAQAAGRGKQDAATWLVESGLLQRAASGDEEARELAELAGLAVNVLPPLVVGDNWTPESVMAQIRRQFGQE